MPPEAGAVVVAADAPPPKEKDGVGREPPVEPLAVVVVFPKLNILLIENNMIRDFCMI